MFLRFLFRFCFKLSKQLIISCHSGPEVVKKTAWMPQQAQIKTWKVNLSNAKMFFLFLLEVTFAITEIEMTVRFGSNDLISDFCYRPGIWCYWHCSSKRRRSNKFQNRKRSCRIHCSCRHWSYNQLYLAQLRFFCIKSYLSEDMAIHWRKSPCWSRWFCAVFDERQTNWCKT